MKGPESTRLFLVLLLVAQAVAAQIKSSSPPQIDHPVYSLVFNPRAAIPELKASYFSPPILCSPDGTAYYGVPEPPTYRERTIHQLDLQQPRSFPYRLAEGLYDVRFTAFYPGDTGLYVLVNAARDSQQTRDVESKQIDPKPINLGAKERHDFLLKFDRSGRYVNRLQLPDELSFYRFAVLEDGTFVALAIDRKTAAVRLPQLNSDGKIVRYLAPPSALGSSQSQAGGSREGNAASAAVSLIKWFFVPVRNKALLFAAGINQVLEIGADGVRREVNIAIPKGYFFDGVLSSNDRWFFLVPRQVEWEPGKIGGKLTSSDYTLYEVDFNDGRFIRELKGAPTPNFGIACEREGVFTGFSIGRESRYVLWTAELPR